MANNKDFKVKNGIQPTVYHEGVGSVTSGSVTTGYNTVDNWAYDSVSFSVSSQSTDPYGVAFKSDGTKMYIAELSGDRIYQYSLSTAYDISTASYDSVSLNTSTEDNPVDVIFKPDGTKLYICGSNNSNIYQYSLSTAWDLSTASYDSVTFSTSSQDIYPYGITFNNDGTKIFLVGNQNNRLYQYSLSTAYDISTMSYTSQFFSFASQDTATTGISFNSNGTKMYAVGFTTDTIYQYSLSTAYDVTSISYDSLSFSVSSQDSQPWSIVFNSDGSKGYVVGHATDTIYQYSTGSTLATATLDLSTGSVFEITPTSDIQIGLSNPAASGTVSAATLLLDGSTAGDGYNLSIASDTGNSFGMSNGATDFVWGNNGYRFYHVNSAEAVYQANLTTPYDLSTATATSSFSTDPQTNDSLGVEIKTDGTKMYVVCQSTDKIYQYSLSTAWDVTTASYDNKSFSLGTGYWWAMLFYNNGLNFIVHRNDTAEYYTYSCSTAWDISTASQVRATSFSPHTPRSLAFNSDGTKFYFGDEYNGVEEYTLSTAYNLATKNAYSDRVTYTVFGTAASVHPLAFNNDGTKLFIGSSSSTVKEYRTVPAATITYDSTLQWGGGTAPDSPAIGETDVLTFTTRDGGTTYQAALSIDGAK